MLWIWACWAHEFGTNVLKYKGGGEICWNVPEIYHTQKNKNYATNEDPATAIYMRTKGAE